MNKLGLQVLNRAARFLHSLPDKEQVIIGAAIESIRERDFESAYVKTLRGPIKELIVGTRRIIFCVESNTMYVLGGFTKKSTKTPRREIGTAEKMYRLLITYKK